MQQKTQNNKTENKDFDKAVDDIINMQDALKHNLEERAKEANENGEEEDVKNDPMYRLLDSILKNSRDILTNPAVTQLFSKLTPTLGKEETLSLIQSLSIIMSYSAYSSLLLYDDLLKEQIQLEFNHISDYLNNTRADVIGQQSALEVFKKRLGEVENKLKIDQIKKAENIS